MAAVRSIHRRWSWTGLLLALLASALWGMTPVATKGALQGWSPEFVSVFRLAAAALLFRILGGAGTRWFVADRWTWLAGIGLGADFVLYNYGLQRTSATVAGLVVNIEMVSTVALAVWLLGERLSVHRVVGSIVTLAGVVAVNCEGVQLVQLTANEQTFGNLLVMTASVAWSLFAVAQRKTRVGTNLFQRLTPIFSVAALTVLPTLAHRGAWTMTGGLAPFIMLVLLAVVCTGLVYFVYAQAQDLIDVSALAILLCSIPIFTVIFAYLLLGEPLTSRVVLGGIIVLMGIVIIATERDAVPDAAAAFAGASMDTPAGA